MILWAEMNGYDFNERILKPWQRDSAFYKTVWTERSDIPAHEVPTHHALLEVWQYKFPLSNEQRLQFLKGLKLISVLNEQARMDNEPHRSELRRSPLLYNIFDSRNEGLATAVEEWL